VLSGLLLNVALYAVLRFKLLLAANPGALAPGPLMVTMGLGSLIFAGFMLYRRRDIKRMFRLFVDRAWASSPFAFGMGGPLANFAGLLHMVMHSLTKSGIFFAVGHIAQVKGTQKIDQIRGLTETHPLLGWGLVLGVVAIAGLPPSASSNEASSWWSARPSAREPLLRLRWSSACWSPSAHSPAPERPRFRGARRQHGGGKASYVPMYLHFSLVLPPPLSAATLVLWFQHIPPGLLG